MKNTTLKINVDAVKHNLEYLGRDHKLCLMVKANNYGIGYEFIPEFIKMGYDFFGVTTIEEADAIRSYDKDVDILIVAYVDPTQYDKALANNYTLTVYNEESLAAIRNNNKYHLKFDTGMGRIGFTKDDVEYVTSIIEETQNIPEGIYSHFPMAINEEFTKQQIKYFKSIVDAFEKIDFKYVHLQNSVGSQIYDLDFVNMKRPGLGIWGFYADLEEKKFVENKVGVNLQPAISLVAKIHMLKEYNGLIGYDLTEKVEGLIGTVRIGYHDGFARSFSGYQFTGNEKVVGKVCMCQAFIAMNEPKANLEIFGSTESIYDLVNYANITVYELLVSLSNRILREW